MANWLKKSLAQETQAPAPTPATTAPVNADAPPTAAEQNATNMAQAPNPQAQPQQGQQQQGQQQQAERVSPQPKTAEEFFQANPNVKQLAEWIDSAKEVPAYLKQAHGLLVKVLQEQMTNGLSKEVANQVLKGR